MKQSFLSRESSSRGQALAVLGTLLFCAPLIWSGLKHAEFDGRPAVRRDAGVSSEGEQELIVTWQGSRVDDPKIPLLKTALLGEVAADGLLRGGSPYIAEVTSAKDVIASLSGAELSADDLLENLAGVWLGRGGLKLKATNNGRRNLEWTAKRIEVELNSTPGRKVSVVQRSFSPVSDASSQAPAIGEYDLEVFCGTADPLAVPASLKEEVLKVRGYPTGNEPEGQRLVEEAFVAVGTPVAVRVRLSEAGSAEPTMAAKAIHRAAAAAGILEEDLLVTGSLLSTAVQAEELRASVNGLRNVSTGAASPFVLALLIAAALSLVSGRFSIELACSIVLGMLGAAGLSAAMNVLGVRWTESLLLTPAVVVALTIAMALLEPAARGGLRERVRKPMSPSTMLAAMCLVTLLAGTNMQRESERSFALAGSAACVVAWVLSTICVPAVAGMWESRPIRRSTHGLDFAEWISTHQKFTTTVAATLGIAAAAVLLQPGVQSWIATSPIHPGVPVQYKVEQALGGTSELAATIRFDAERTQRMRFLERANIVRAAVEKVKSCGSVTGAMSLAQLVPIVPRPAEDAKTRERTAYISRSNRVAEQVRAQNATLGGTWILGGDSDEDLASTPGEAWIIKVSVAELSAESPDAVIAKIHRGIQDVLRFHAGVSHEISGHLAVVAANSLTLSRRPAVLGLLAVLSLIVASVGAGSFGRGLAASAVVMVPGLAILMIPGFRPQQFGPAAFLAMALPLCLGVLACVR
ncbi:MAG TPA: hypothetical protein VM510_07650, partial [Caulifigura sp.]|nr:hypothetical protein [Caulifigura sp.]